jgi:hypothetical protein
MTAPVETRRLTKRYGALTAVDGLDLTAARDRAQLVVFAYQSGLVD